MSVIFSNRRRGLFLLLLMAAVAGALLLRIPFQQLADAAEASRGPANPLWGYRLSVGILMLGLVSLFIGQLRRQRKRSYQAFRIAALALLLLEPLLKAGVIHLNAWGGASARAPAEEVSCKLLWKRPEGAVVGFYQCAPYALEPRRVVPEVWAALKEREAVTLVVRPGLLVPFVAEIRK